MLHLSTRRFCSDSRDQLTCHTSSPARRINSRLKPLAAHTQTITAPPPRHYPVRVYKGGSTMANVIEIAKAAVTAYNEKDWNKTRDMLAADALYDEKATNRP